MFTQSNICIIITIVLYLAFMLYLGFRYADSSSQSVGDFYLGGRKLGPLVTAMSAEASDMSSWLLMGLPGLAYSTGICDVTWTALGIGIGTYLNWLIVAKRLRTYTEHIGADTVPDFFERRSRTTAICSWASLPWSSWSFSSPTLPPASPPAASCSPPCSALTIASL